MSVIVITLPCWAGVRVAVKFAVCFAALISSCALAPLSSNNFPPWLRSGRAMAINLGSGASARAVMSRAGGAVHCSMRTGHTVTVAPVTRAASVKNAALRTSLSMRSNGVRVAIASTRPGNPAPEPRSMARSMGSCMWAARVRLSRMWRSQMSGMSRWEIRLMVGDHFATISASTSKRWRTSADKLAETGDASSSGLRDPSDRGMKVGSTSDLPRLFVNRSSSVPRLFHVKHNL